MHEIWSFPSSYPVCMAYLGFTYNGCHSSEFGLYRVSSGDRYNTDLTPTNEIKTLHVPGQEGSYYYGTTYKEKIIPLNIAFDELTEAGVMALKAWLSNGVVADFILDEKPYKAYYAKPNDMLSLSIIPFDKYNKTLNQYETVYKGEGTITFTCYSPFAHNTFKYINQFNAGKGSDYFNLRIPKKVRSDFETDEWKNSVNLLESKIIKDTEGQEQDGGAIRYDTSIAVSNSEGKVMQLINRYYNPGDMETYPYILIKLCLCKESFNGIRLLKNSHNLSTQESQQDGCLVIYNKEGFTVKSPNEYHCFLINTRTRNVEYWVDDSYIDIGEGKKQFINKYIYDWEGSNNFSIQPTPINNLDDNFILEVLKDGMEKNNNIDFNEHSELQVLYKYYYY